MTTTHRPIYSIAADITRDWKKPYFGAVPYLAAMRQLTTVESAYGADSAESILLYFLSNAHSWRGPVARVIKKELNSMVR